MMTRNGRLGALLRVTLRLSIVFVAACGILDAYVRYTAALDGAVGEHLDAADA